MEALRAIFPAASGRPVDPCTLDEVVHATPGFANRLEGYANLFFTRFEGRIRGGDRALQVTGPQVGALIGALHAALESLRGRLPGRVAAMLGADALARACAARALAEVDRSANPDVAFAVSFCLDLGVWATLDQDASAQIRWWRQVRRARGARRRANAETVLGVDPKAESARMMQEIGLPANLVEVIAAPAHTLPAADRALGRIVARADALGEALAAVDSGPALAAWVADCATWPQIPAEGAWRLIADVMQVAPRAAQAFSMPFQPWGELTWLATRQGRLEVVEEAAELGILVDLQGEALRAAEHDRQRMEEQVVARLAVDPATDLPTLSTLVTRLSATLLDPSAPVGALVCVDVRDFGTLFAREGLRASDRVLARVARTLGQVFREASLMGRCGPATFVVVVPGSARMARVLAERARVALARLEVPGREAPLPLKVDVGVLDLDDLPRGLRAEAVLEAARRTLDRYDTNWTG
jgi:GGDEF domain-containing protein